MGYSQEYPESYTGHYRFSKKRVSGHAGEWVFGGVCAPGYVMNDPWFEYNADDGLYYRFQYGGPHNGDEGQLIG